MLAMDHIEAPLLASLPLRAGDEVVVAGAYKGDTVRFLLHHHPDVLIHAYEPQLWAMNEIPDDPRVIKCPYALSTHGGPVLMHSIGTDAASMEASLEETANSRKLDTLRSSAAALELDDMDIALMVLNVEGYEYTLLPYLLENGIQPQRLLVQFHHYATHKAAPFLGLTIILERRYMHVQDVGKGWWYYSA